MDPISRAEALLTGSTDLAIGIGGVLPAIWTLTDPGAGADSALGVCSSSSAVLQCASLLAAVDIAAGDTGLVAAFPSPTEASRMLVSSIGYARKQLGGSRMLFLRRTDAKRSLQAIRESIDELARAMIESRVDPSSRAVGRRDELLVIRHEKTAQRGNAVEITVMLLAAAHADLSDAIACATSTTEAWDREIACRSLLVGASAAEALVRGAEAGHWQAFASRRVRGIPYRVKADESVRRLADTAQLVVTRAAAFRLEALGGEAHLIVSAVRAVAVAAERVLVACGVRGTNPGTA